MSFKALKSIVSSFSRTFYMWSFTIRRCIHCQQNSVSKPRTPKEHLDISNCRHGCFIEGTRVEGLIRVVMDSWAILGLNYDRTVSLFNFKTTQITLLLVLIICQNKKKSLITFSVTKILFWISVSDGTDTYISDTHGSHKM